MAVTAGTPPQGPDPGPETRGPGRRVAWTLAGLALVALTAWADYATGPEASIVLLYLIPVALVSLRAGLLAGVFAAWAAGGGWLIADRVLAQPYSNAWIPYWNAAVRLGIFVLVAVLLAQLQGALERGRRQRAILEELNQVKNRFLGMAAHDLRTPIAVIQIYADLALDEEGAVLGERQRRSLEVIRAKSRFMLGLVTDLLDIARIESGRLELRLERRDYGEFLLGKVAELETLAAQRGLKIRTEVEAGLPSLVFDGERIEQVLDNLVLNALKFSPPGGELTVAVRRAAGGVETLVRDQGPGIPPAQRPAIFQPFTVGRAAAPGGEKGTGLGLAIAKRIVEAHGGRISVEGVEGGGAVFVYTLPLAVPGVGTAVGTAGGPAAGGPAAGAAGAVRGS